MKVHICWVVILAVVVIVAVLMCFVRGRWQSREEIDAEGMVIIKGDRVSRFAAQYRTAADLLARGRLSEAESLYKELAEKEPNSPYARVGLAGCCMKREDFMGARKLYQEALELEPKSVGALVGLGSSYCGVSDYANAGVC